VLRTDTHFRAKNGKASFNWRLKYPITLSSAMKYQRLQVQLWDKDLISANDMIGEATLKLDRWFKRVYKRKQKMPNYWDGEGQLPQYDKETKGTFETLTEAVESLSADSPLLTGREEDPALESSKFWVPLSDFNRDPTSTDKADKEYFEQPPRIVMSLQLIPKAQAEKIQAGDGRSEPNKNPVMPKPVGRLRFTLNPFSIISQLVGPEICRKLQCILCQILCCALCVLLAYYTVPVVFGNIVSEPFVG